MPLAISTSFNNNSRTRLNSAVTVDVASFQVHPLPTAEANAVRADFLVYDQRTKDALELLGTVLRDDPNNALAHETMGYLKFTEHDIPAAQKWYSEAVQLDSQSYLAHYYFATMTMQSGERDRDTEIESSLRTSIKLNPSFAFSYDSLAMFYASRNQKLDEAHILNIQAVQLEPENLNFRLNAANVLSQQRQYGGAIGVLKLALPVAKSQVEKEMVLSRIQSLEQFQASLDRASTQRTETASQSSIGQAGITPDGANNPNKTVVFQRVNGKIIGMMEETPNYPAADSKGMQHTIKGVLRNIRCSYPTVLALTVEQPSGQKTTLYTNNYYKVVFTTINYEPDGDIKPCTGIEDMKASVKYAEVTDKNVAGQILTIDLSK
jgi:tetratricopeptide (TPR) repeat protein